MTGSPSSGLKNDLRGARLEAEAGAGEGRRRASGRWRSSGSCAASAGAAPVTGELQELQELQEVQEVHEVQEVQYVQGVRDVQEAVLVAVLEPLLERFSCCPESRPGDCRW